MNTFGLRVLSSDGIFYEGRCQMLIVPAIDGELAVQAHHQDVIVAITAGEMRIQKEDENWQDAVVGSGFMQVVNNRVVLIVDTAERPEDIDIRRAKEAKERAEEQLRQKQSIREYYHTQASLARAMSRLKAASKHR